MKRKLTIAAGVCLIVALVALSVVSCAKVTPGPTPTPGPGPTLGPGPTPPTPPPAGPQYGGTLRIADSVVTGASVLGYPPTMTKTNEPQYVYGCVELLICFDEAGAPAPFLATGWEVSPDLTSITLTLRKGIKFHDGTDFNAEAVKWNLDNYRLSGRVELKKVESIDVVDDYTLRLNLSEFDNLIITNLGGYPGLIISPTAYETHGQDWCEAHPVGTGPFRFVSWERDVSIKFERFDDYWQEGKPYLDGYEWVAIVDPMVSVAAFKAGEVDTIIRVNAKDAKDMEMEGKYKITKVATGLSGIGGDGAHLDSVFGDIRVRQAVEHAIDKQALCDALDYGYSQPVNQPARVGGWAYNPDVIGYPYNPEKARELLAEAGYPNGFKTTIYTLSMPTYVQSMTAIQGYLKEVGIDAGMQLMDHGAYFHVYIGGGWENGIAIYPMGLQPPDELALLSKMFAPDSLVFVSTLRPAEYQDVLAQALLAPDFETKKAKVHELNRLMTDKYAMCIWLSAGQSIAARYPEVHDDGLFQISISQWTPADAWIGR